MTPFRRKEALGQSRLGPHWRSWPLNRRDDLDFTVAMSMGVLTIDVNNDLSGAKTVHGSHTYAVQGAPRVVRSLIPLWLRWMPGRDVSSALYRTVVPGFLALCSWDV